MRVYERRIKKYDPEVLKTKAILADLEVQYRFSWTEKRLWYSGQFKKGRVYVYPRMYSGNVAVSRDGYEHYLTRRCTVQEFLSTVFHEVGHAMQDRKKRFSSYTSGFDTTAGYEAFKKWVAESFIAERDADRIGKRLMQKYFPRIPYRGNYSGRRGRLMMQSYVNAVQRTYFPGTKLLTVTDKKATVKV